MKTKDLLDDVYEKLDFNNGQLFEASEKPLSNIGNDIWINNGEWLSAAKRAGAEKVFFVKNNPVIVFAKCSSKNDEIKCYNKLWSLARPRILFLESPGELSVIDLAQKPIYNNKNKLNQKLEKLTTLEQTNDVVKMLQSFHRNNIESGKVFENGRFGDIRFRADQTLINDLKIVRRELLDAGLEKEYAHALIGRSIFIRYLEDRKILTNDYFKKTASNNNHWLKLLNTKTTLEELDFSNNKALYPRILQDKNFTFNLFKTLSKDFNGDMFPGVDEEEHHTDIKHLNLIRGLLYGDDGIKEKLFFFSYNFEIIPLDLISAIYEEFYQTSTKEKDKKSKSRQDGAYYTPPVLAEFVLSRILTERELQKNPRVLDLACGSGIFLVEAFRRIVRFKNLQKLAPLDFNELKNILGNQILGIEINEEAARITAFSLYLAMLHYLDPPSIQEQIQKGNKLPNLLVKGLENKNNQYKTILVGDTFSIDKNIIGRVDIIVGNPPWGAPGNQADETTKQRQILMEKWCKSNSYPIGDKEPSQAFLWRAYDLLIDGGCCALLTSSGVLLKHAPKSKKFREKWMSVVCIKEIFNFSLIRNFFFNGAIAPFILICFTKAKQDSMPVEYWTAKKVIAMEETKSILFSKYDRNLIINQNFADNKIWKINMFGRYADFIFIKQINHLEKLHDFIIRKKSGQGYSGSPEKNEFSELQGLSSLSIEYFSRYDSLIFKNPPKKFYKSGIIDSYHGKRLLIKKGIPSPKGEIVSRFETNDFCFTNSINSLKLKVDDENQYKLLLGILWSSLSRYFYFNISANWGLWHDEIHLDDELLQLPIPHKLSEKNTKRILEIVDKLRNYHPEENDLFTTKGKSKEDIDKQRKVWENELDLAVFDLYEFTEEQRDLIRDCCEVTLPFFYDPYKSIGVKPVIENNDISWIKNYAETFARRWKAYLNDDEDMRVDVHIGASENMVALEFYPADIGDKWDFIPKDKTWNKILEEIEKSIQIPMGSSQTILDGIVQVVSNDSIIIIKRNEKRFWTRSLAREDADSTICKRMVETKPLVNGLDNVS